MEEVGMTEGEMALMRHGCTDGGEAVLWWVAESVIRIGECCEARRAVVWHFRLLKIFWEAKVGSMMEGQCERVVE